MFNQQLTPIDSSACIEGAILYKYHCINFVLYCIVYVLYCIVLYCIVLYCIVIINKTETYRNPQLQEIKASLRQQALLLYTEDKNMQRRPNTANLHLWFFQQQEGSVKKPQ